jgi:hypothetical protein
MRARFDHWSGEEQLRARAPVHVRCVRARAFASAGATESTLVKLVKLVKSLFDQWVKV